MNHAFRVASNFTPFSPAWFLSLLHDVPEDYPSMRWLCKLWPALDAITRRDGEPYLDEYIYRVAKSRLATLVKIMDITDNLMRKDGVMPDSYKRRLYKARTILSDELYFR